MTIFFFFFTNVYFNYFFSRILDVVVVVVLPTCVSAFARASVCIMYVYVSRDVCTCISVCLVRVCVYACTQSMCYLKMAYGSNRKFSFDIRCERITRSEKFIEFLFKFITMSSFFLV